MKFRYELKGYLTSLNEVKYSTGIEALIDSNINDIDMSERYHDMTSALYDSDFTLGVEADTSSKNDTWYKKLWKWIKDLFLKVIRYIKSGFKWI